MRVSVINKAGLLMVLILFANGMANAQVFLSVDSCYTLARRNYPMVSQFDLIEKSREYSLENVSKGSLPQIMVAGQASYQSDVTQVQPAEGAPPLPFSFPVISKDQYKIYGEVVQPLTDLFTIKRQKEMVQVNADVEAQRVEVELYKLYERVNQLFFGILLIDDQLSQTALLERDIQTGLSKTQAAVENGIALRSSLDLLRAELLKVKQRTIDLRASRRSYLEMLSMFIGQPLDENVHFEKPSLVRLSSTINRPETKLFEKQRQVLTIQGSLVDARTLPRFSLFVQGGYGRPALNMLNNDFDFYYVGGLRLSWNISSFYTFRRDKQLLIINQNSLNVQEETFLFNTRLTLKQHESDIIRLQELISTDDEIISLRANIKNTAQIQLEQGTITALDYIDYVNAEMQARQERSLHETQLLMAQRNYEATTGN